MTTYGGEARHERCVVLESVAESKREKRENINFSSMRSGNEFKQSLIRLANRLRQSNNKREREREREIKM